MQNEGKNGEKIAEIREEIEKNRRTYGKNQKKNRRKQGTFFFFFFKLRKQGNNETGELIRVLTYEICQDLYNFLGAVAALSPCCFPAKLYLKNYGNPRVRLTCMSMDYVSPLIQ